MGHDPQRPVGKGIEIDGHYVKALIAEPTAKHLIRTKVLNDFSVGIMNPDIRVGDPRFKHLDPMGKAVRGVITDRPDGPTALGEISVVDRGSNFGSSFQIAKAAADGSPEFTGKLFAPDDVLAKVPAPPVTKARRGHRHRRAAQEHVPVGEALRPRQAGHAAAEAGPRPGREQGGCPLGDEGRRAGRGQGVPRVQHRAAGGTRRPEQRAPRRQLPDPDADALRRAAILARSKHGNWKAAASSSPAAPVSSACPTR